MYQLYAEMNDEREILIAEYPDPTFFEGIVKNLTKGNYTIYIKTEMLAELENFAFSSSDDAVIIVYFILCT